MKNAVPVSSLVFLTEPDMRAKPKSASMARGGVESEIRMFDWEQYDFKTEPFVGVK